MIPVLSGPKGLCRRRGVSQAAPRSDTGTVQPNGGWGERPREPESERSFRPAGRRVSPHQTVPLPSFSNRAWFGRQCPIAPTSSRAPSTGGFVLDHSSDFCLYYCELETRITRSRVCCTAAKYLEPALSEECFSPPWSWASPTKLWPSSRRRPSRP